MEKLVVGLRNKKVDFFENEQLYLFYSERQAEAQLTRSLRDALMDGQVNVDWLKEHSYMAIASFDSISGEFWSPNDPLDVPFEIDCYQVCKDLLKKENNDDNS